MSMIGHKTPEWTATAYVNGEQKTIGSKDYAGKWHVLYWYPLDFTFVCPTEIKGFQEKSSDFKDDRVELVGVSTDSFYSHKAWFADRKTFPQEITHPVIADTNHAVSRAFGVLKKRENTPAPTAASPEKNPRLSIPSSFVAMRYPNLESGIGECF